MLNVTCRRCGHILKGDGRAPRSGKNRRHDLERTDYETRNKDGNALCDPRIGRHCVCTNGCRRDSGTSDAALLENSEGRMHEPVPGTACNDGQGTASQGSRSPPACWQGSSYRARRTKRGSQVGDDLLEGRRLIQPPPFRASFAGHSRPFVPTSSTPMLRATRQRQILPLRRKDVALQLNPHLILPHHKCRPCVSPSGVPRCKPPQVRN